MKARAYRFMQWWGERLCRAVPVLMLAANVLAWLRYGTDLPYFDDWRGYASGDIGSFQLVRLFQVVNNTMSPVGFALDALAQRGLNGNAVAYQLLSMLLVLGGLLWLQWKLLQWAITNTVIRAVAFAFTVFMLQSSTYWGEQNLAYHQALPLFFLLAALYVSLATRWAPIPLFGIVALLGVLAGFSYISGAVATMVTGSILLARTHALPLLWKDGAREPFDETRAKAACGGMALLLTGLAATAYQFYATRLSGNSDHSETAPVRWPTDPDFWAYMLGKVGRSLGSPFHGVGAELTLAVGVAGGLVIVLLVFIRQIMRGATASGDEADETHDLEPGAFSLRRLSYVYLPMAGSILVYLGLVSFGRAGYRDASIQSMPEVFQFAYQRFHFFWVTLLLPWTVAALLLLLRVGQRRWTGVMMAGGVLVLGWGLAGARGVFDVSTYYEQGARARAATIRCIHAQLGSGGPIMCPELALPGWVDWTPALVRAREMGASFTKYFPVVEPPSPRQWLFEGSPQGQAGVAWHDADVAGGGWRQGLADPLLLIESHQAKSFARCRVLMVRLALRSEKETMAKVFYRPNGKQGFSAEWSQSRPVPVSPDAPVELRFAFESSSGFAPVLRIDPVGGGVRFFVEDVRIGCGLQGP